MLSIVSCRSDSESSRNFQVFPLFNQVLSRQAVDSNCFFGSGGKSVIEQEPESTASSKKWLSGSRKIRRAKLEVCGIPLVFTRLALGIQTGIVAAGVGPTPANHGLSS